MDYTLIGIIFVFCMDILNLVDTKKKFMEGELEERHFNGDIFLIVINVAAAIVLLMKGWSA